MIGNINGGKGDDTMLVQGTSATNKVTITGNIDGGEDSDKLTVTFASVTGDIIMGAGNDGDANDVKFDTNAVINGRIIGNSGDDTVHVNNNASIDDVFMDSPSAATPVGVANGVGRTAGTDHLWINGSAVQLDSAKRLDGGDDVSDADGKIDILHLNGWSGTAPTLTNWERINLTSAASVVLPRETTAGTINIANGTTLRPMDDNTGNDVAAHNITANVVNNGTLTYQDSATNDNPTITGNYSGTGRVLLDINSSDHGSDILTITGDNTGTIDININNLATTSDSQDIPLVTVNGSNKGSAIINGGGDTYTVGGVTYKLKLLGSTWTLVVQKQQSAPATVPAIGWLSLLSMIGLMVITVFSYKRRIRQCLQ